MTPFAWQVRKLDTVRHENDGLKQDVQQIRPLAGALLRFFVHLPFA